APTDGVTRRLLLRRRPDGQGPVAGWRRLVGAAATKSGIEPASRGDDRRPGDVRPAPTTP
ncbi:hypothetical protein NGM37_06255, partial [Streptomyces sp. TRM76130]|nr:hypothetical protein [Streptomyces sp. TRM76130]